MQNLNTDIRKKNITNISVEIMHQKDKFDLCINHITPGFPLISKIKQQNQLPHSIYQ